MNKRRLIVRLKGGLGNQMFQYAAGRALSIQNGMQLVLDTESGFVRDKIYRRRFSLDDFPIRGERAVALEQLPFWCEQALQRPPSKAKVTVRRPWGVVLQESEEGWTKEAAEYVLLARRTWMDGYWQSERYFWDYRDVIGRELTLPVPGSERFLATAGTIESCDSVAVGVRVFEEVPTDVRSAVGGVVPLSFYEEAACRLRGTVKEPTFFVFCTTLGAVEGKLSLPGKVHYFTHDNGFEGALQMMWLISRCKHHILSNSSFYWWAAWLAEHAERAGMIIAADWFVNRDTIPERWSRVGITRRPPERR